MPKRDIRMSEAEIDGFLRAQSTAVVVAAAGDGGAPIGAVGRLSHDVNSVARVVAFAVRDDDPVVAHLASDDRACCVVEQFPSYLEIMGVMLHGRVSRRRDAAPGEAVYDMAVERVVSFDFGKLAT